MANKLSSARISLVGLELGLSVTLGILIGLYLDNKMDSTPLFILVFMSLGTAAGFRNLYKVLKQMEKDE